MVLFRSFRLTFCIIKYSYLRAANKDKPELRAAYEDLLNLYVMASLADSTNQHQDMIDYLDTGVLPESLREHYNSMKDLQRRRNERDF